MSILFKKALILHICFQHTRQLFCECNSFFLMLPIPFTVRIHNSHISCLFKQKLCLDILDIRICFLLLQRLKNFNSSNAFYNCGNFILFILFSHDMSFVTEIFDFPFIERSSPTHFY